MSIRKNLKHRRFSGALIIAVLLFNIVSSVVLANSSSEGQYSWLCTSQGLIKVALDDGTADLPDASPSNHCPYCNLFDIAYDLTAGDLAYPRPPEALSNDYTPPSSAFNNHPAFSSRLLRAPPAFSLI